MANKHNQSITAFSLIEISIVLLLIGLIIGGIAQAGRLMQKSAIISAKAQTKSSPAALIDDLVFWLETTSDQSFNPTEAVDNTEIGTWYNITPSVIAKTSNSATQSTLANKPKYIAKSSINNLPAVRFDGSNDFMSYDGSFLVKNSYTIFVVEMRRASGNMFILGGDASVAAGANFHFGYFVGNTFRAGNYGSSAYLDYAIGAFSSPVARIHTFTLDTTSGEKYWLNGGTTADSTNVSGTTTLSSYASAVIGRNESQFYYNGDLGEVIIYSRALDDTERQDVERYLVKKWKIKLQ
jgi:hypothetical protein